MIYSLYEGVIPDELLQPMNEAFTINKNPTKDFYKIAKSIIDDIVNTIKPLQTRTNLFINYPTMENSKSFLKSVDKAYEIINNRERGKAPLDNMNSRFGVNLYIGDLSFSKHKPTDVGHDISKIFAKNGFKLMNQSKKFLKRVFQDILLYKFMPDGSIMVANFGVYYATYNGISDYTRIKIIFKSVLNDDRSLKALNLVESTENIINEGIFDNIRNTKNMDKSKEYKKKNYNNSITKNNKSENIRKTKFTGKELDDILETNDKVFKESLDKLRKSIQDLIDKSNVSKAYKFMDYDDDYIGMVIYDNYYQLDCEFPIIFNGIIGVDLWDVEPKARTDYKSSPACKEVFELNKKIISIIEQHFSSKGLHAEAFEEGDWDTFNICVAYPVSNLGLPYKIDTEVNESTIFKYADLN